MYINLLVLDFLILATNAKCIRGKRLGTRVWNCCNAGNKSKILQWAQQGPTQRWLQDDQRELSNLLWAEKPCKIGSGEEKIQKVSLQLPL